MPAAPTQRDRATLALVTLTIAALYLYRVPLLLVRNYDPDEFQHLHGAYCVARGLVPYLDYYEHHPPGSAWLLAPLVRVLGETWTTVLAGRALMLAFTAGILALTFALGRRVVGARTAALGVLLLSTTQLFVDKSLEVRPDVPATLLWLAGLAVLLRANDGERKRPFAVAGLLFGASFMFTPKLAFGVIGAVLGVSIVALQRVQVAQRVRGLAVLAAASFVPLVVTLAVLGAEGAATEFVRQVVLAPLVWPREASALPVTRELWVGSPGVVLGGTLGVLGWLWVGARRGSVSPGTSAERRADTGLVLACAALVFVVGWFSVPVPWPQFLLPLLPLWALAAAAALVWTTERSVDTLERVGAPAVLTERLVPLALAAAAAWFAWRSLGPYMPPRGVYAAFLALVGATLLVAPSRERLRFALLLLVLAVPLARVVGRTIWQDTEVRRDFEFLMANTAPDDTVLTGWSTATMFRPHAYEYSFLHGGMLAVLTEQQKGEDVLAILRVRPPRVVVRDAGTRALSAEVNRFIDGRYAPTGVGDLWLRRVP